MAREEQPDQFTKSVPLAGGMQDDVPEFLQEFPSMAYVENGRFRKTNEVEKTLPETDISPSSPPFGDSIAVETTRSSLLAIGENGAQEYTVAAGWNDIAGSGNVIAKLHDICSTSQVPGGMHFDWAFGTKGDDVYVTACETRSAGDSEPRASDFAVIIEIFTPDGVPIKKEFVLYGKAPQVNTTGDGRVVVHYVKPGIAAPDVIWVYDVSTDTHTKLLNTDGNSELWVTYDTLVMEALWDAASTVTWEDDNGNPQPMVPGGYNEVRAGFNPVGVNVWYKVDYSDAGNGAILWGNRWYADEIWLTEVGDDGLVTPSSNERLIRASGFNERRYFPLSVSAFDTGYWVLWGERNAGINTSTLWAGKYSLDMSTNPVLEPIELVATMTIVNGSIAADSFGGAWIAYTRVESDETVVRDTLNGLVQINHGNLSSGGTWQLFGSIDDHRITSNNVNNGLTQAVTIEQWGFFEPQQIALTTDKVDVLPIAGLKPTTSILVRIGAGDPEELISTFDATTSKHTNYSMQEQNPFLGKLRLVNGDFFYCNRQLLQGEDMSILTNRRLGTGEDDDYRNVWYLGEYRGNLYQVEQNPEKIQSTKFGESVILNTAFPLWYAGGDLTEMSVLEQPEIRYLDAATLTTNDRASGWCYVDPYNEVADTWSVYQIVVGYADPNGHLHRSAPSFPLWVADLDKSKTDETERDLGFTMPVTSFSDKTSYFIEVFAAREGEELKLAYSSQIKTNNITFKDQYNFYIAGPTVDTKHNPLRTSENPYTAGGELAADPWPSFDQAVVTSRRMFAVEGSTLYFSKLFLENIAPEFNAVLTIPFGRGRKLWGLGKIDDKVIVFEKDTIHAVYGDGPDNVGEGGAFIVDHLQTTVGCSDPESIVEIPEGLLFYSSNTQEFHMVNRDNEVVDIGKAVQDLSANIDIKSAIVFPKEHEVRWYVTGGPTEEFGPPAHGPPERPPRPRYTNILPTNPVFVFNFHYNKWTVLSEQPAISTTLLNDEVVRIDNSWNVFQTSNEWANAKLLKYRLPWFRTQNLQSFGRIRDIDMLGKYLSAWFDGAAPTCQAGDIKVTSRYDYEADGLYHEYLWKANQDLVLSDGDRLQISLHPGKPKCQAIQITVEEVPTEKVDDSEPTYTNGRGFVLSGLDLVYSIKRGLGSKSLGRRRRK